MLLDYRKNQVLLDYPNYQGRLYCRVNLLIQDYLWLLLNPYCRVFPNYQ